ncbi:hypothetical protein LMG29542_08450 [Paraburkholderia humisilvae]|uniref:Uncharacterized protein n=3 Tax=Paraburkholderia humisilvae TaxID=627669 RepID=A0A6J5F825_9BURK|nr:hypothetical protein LMG29542_08450 [Paraburkholderia humisilvae]
MQITYNSASNLKTGMSGEILSDSALNYGNSLPLKDPREIEIPSTIDCSSLDSIIDQASIAPKIEDSQKNRSPDEVCNSILHYLNSRNLQFNSRSEFRSHTLWKSIVQRSISSGQKIGIIIPIFCNIGNPLKRFQETTVTAAEITTLKFLANVAREVQNLYPPGLCFKVVVDANFYSTPFMNSVIETNAYYKGLVSWVAKNGFCDEIDVIDMMDLLCPRSNNFTARFNHWMNILESTPKTENVEASKWGLSMVCSINLRHLSNDYSSIYSCYSNSHSELRKEVLERSTKSLVVYRSLKNAAADIYWEDLIDSNCIRATIHTKSIPVLGLRVYPEYKKSSRLLPYHGISVFTRKSESTPFRMQVLTEMDAVNLPGVVRYRSSDGITQAYVAPPGISAQHRQRTLR